MAKTARTLFAATGLLKLANRFDALADQREREPDPARAVRFDTGCKVLRHSSADLTRIA